MGFKKQQKNRWYGKGIITEVKTLRVLEKETKQDKKIIHYFNYPQNPKSNAYIDPI